MAEFQEVAKMYKRLCESYDECYKCPMFRNRDKNDQIACRYWTLIIDPETAEKVILHWDKEHQKRKKGRWIDKYPNLCRVFYCSECGKSFVVGPGLSYKEWIKGRNFCENCGADMREDGEANENH